MSLEPILRESIAEVRARNGAVERWDCTHEEYYALDGRDSNSSLNVFRKSWARYHGIYVTKRIKPPEPTPEMRFGNLLHTLLLEPESFLDRYAIAPNVDKRTKDGRHEWQRFSKEASLKTIVTADDVAQAESMADAVRRKVDVDGDYEIALRWQDAETGLLMKCKLDIFNEDRVIDIKTGVDPAPDAFQRAAWNYGYHRQADLYKTAAEKLMESGLHYYIIAVGKTEPYDVAGYSLSPDLLERGRQQNRITLQQLAKCKETGEWDQHSEPYSLEAPRWA